MSLTGALLYFRPQLAGILKAVPNVRAIFPDTAQGGAEEVSSRQTFLRLDVRHNNEYDFRWTRWNILRYGEMELPVSGNHNFACNSLHTISPLLYG
jgi:hypothetical protein